MILPKGYRKTKGKSGMLYEAVLFDMDGLLLDTERQYLNTFIETCESFGVSGLEQVYYDCIGFRLVDSQKVLQKGLGHLVDLASFTDTWDALTLEVRSKHIPVKTGAKELLGQLADAGIPCVVATSTGTEKAIHHLKKAGLYELIMGLWAGTKCHRANQIPKFIFGRRSWLGRRLRIVRRLRIAIPVRARPMLQAQQPCKCLI